MVRVGVTWAPRRGAMIRRPGGRAGAGEAVVVGALAAASGLVVACAVLEEGLEPQAEIASTTAEVAQVITTPRSWLAFIVESFPCRLAVVVISLLADMDNDGGGFLPEQVFIGSGSRQRSEGVIRSDHLGDR
jgi:hypothetical protein